MIIFGGDYETYPGSTFGTGARYCATACTPLTWYRDNDGDGFGDLTSTASECTRPVGYVTNNTDSCDNDSSTWSLPSEARSLTIEKVPVNATLDRVTPSSPGTSNPIQYDVLRSTTPSDFTSAHATCVATYITATTANDPASPAVGSVSSYLVRGRNICGYGTLGTRSSGATRAGRACP